MRGRGDEEVLRFASQAGFESWLERNHDGGAGIWLEIAKKGTSEPTVTYDEAVEAALCFGWIDGQKASGDDAFWLQRFTPRSRRSRWSRINRDKAERLLDEGRVRRPGVAEIERARADGRWNTAYEGQRTARIPDDLRGALDADPVAADAFAKLDARNRYAIIWRLNDAKRAETRTRRLATFVDMLHRGGTIH